MSTKEETRQQTTNAVAAAELPLPTPSLPPEAVAEHVRTLRGQIGEVTPLTPAQRAFLRRQTRTTNQILQAQINLIGGQDLVQQAVGQAADEVRQMYDEANRWTAVEDELRTTLNGVAGANLIRHQRIALVAGRAYNISAQLARDPAHAVLVPQVLEIKRLKGFKRRKKATKAPGTPQSPAPAKAVTEGGGTSGSQEP
jgi:hypothetical protein